MSKRTPKRKKDCCNGHFYSLLLSSPIPPSSPPFLSPSWKIYGILSHSDPKRLANTSCFSWSSKGLGLIRVEVKNHFFWPIEIDQSECTRVVSLHVQIRNRNLQLQLHVYVDLKLDNKSLCSLYSQLELRNLKRLIIIVEYYLSGSLLATSLQGWL